MESSKDRAAVFILMGQSNAVGHGLPMTDADKITVPMQNVFGLRREQNQSYDSTQLYWSGWTSAGTNLAEEQDDTYSVANCLARVWQDEIDGRNPSGLPDLYIVHIAIGAQGVTEGYMWHPDREPVLVPGKLGTVNISLYPFAEHVFTLMGENFAALGLTPDYMGIHWRGGENDTTVPSGQLAEILPGLYRRIFDGFRTALGEAVPVILHRIVCPERCLDMDPSGRSLESMHCINRVFEQLCAEQAHMTLFDPRTAPFFVPNVRGNGIFKEDVVHFTPEMNLWTAKEILKAYKVRQSRDAVEKEGEQA